MANNLILHDSNSFPTEIVPTEEDISLFKNQVSEWLKLDEQIKKLSIAIRERKTHQRALATKIQEFMLKFKYDNLNTQQGIIKSTVRQVKEPLKVAYIKTKIMEYASNNADLTPTEIIQKVFEEDRKTVEKKSLKRVIPKISMNLEL